MELSETDTMQQIPQETETAHPIRKIGEEQVREAGQILQKYKSGKAQLERKLIENEQFWKLRHWESVQGKKKRTPATAWLWNVIVSKHADMEDSYPEPGFLPRAADDEEEAKRLSSVVPVILEQNDFHAAYSDCAWYKLKQGASCYGVFWDKDKSGGLGDISIKKIDFINLFWEPGITDIQQSRHLFHVELVDNDILIQRYPDLKDKLSTPSVSVSKYLYDDSVDTSEKSSVVDWYYHTEYGGRRVLQYCKFVNDTVLFATENEPEDYPDGLYRHGLYPFVVDSLYDIEGSICGYGYTDICKDTQIQIDLLSDAIIKNARTAAKPRYFYRDDGSINEEEFSNIENELVHVTGNLGEDSIRQITINGISGNYISILQNKIEELKETSGNRDVNNGSTQSGVTAASAIAALQEASGKTSRDMIKTTYDAYKKIVDIVIELIREFYTIERQFRITGENGQFEYISYSNAALKPQEQGAEFGVDTGYRVPCFDIEVSPQKANPYNKMSQNELALQFYQLGFFNPQMSDQAIACLQAMDFETRDKLVDTIRQNGTMYDVLIQLAQIAYSYAAQINPQQAMQIQQLVAQVGAQNAIGNVGAVSMPTSANDEGSHMTKAREQAANATQPR